VINEKERVEIALAEVGLMPTDGGETWMTWDKALDANEIRLVLKARQLIRRLD